MLSSPSTDGEWKGAKVPFDSLKVPKWATSPEPLDLKTLKKINFKISDAAVKEGTFAIDKVYSWMQRLQVLTKGF
jgi:hypothetical protein